MTRDTLTKLLQDMAKNARFMANDFAKKAGFETANAIDEDKITDIVQAKMYAMKSYALTQAAAMLTDDDFARQIADIYRKDEGENKQ